MRQRNGSRIAWPSAVSVLLFELAFLAAYRLDVASARNGAAPFWFADAILLCGLLLSRPKEWWFYVLATVPIRFFLFVPRDTSSWLLFASFASDSLKGLLSAWLLQRPSGKRAWFDNLHEFSRYFLVAVLLAPGLSAFTGAASHTVLGGSFWTRWSIGLLGGALANLVLVPFILLVLNYKRFVLENLRYVDRLFAPIGASGFLILMSLMSVWGTRLGRGPFYLQSHEDSLLSMQLFLFFASAPFMFLSVITYQQRRNLIESEERFRSIVDVAPVMLWTSGNDARCTFFNKPWLDFTGLSLKEEMEQDWVVRVHADDRERCVTTYLAGFKSRENFTLEYRLLRNDGVYRWVLHTGVPRYAADGSFLGYIGTRVDFTDRREAEERLRELSAELLNAEEIERYRIGHELHDDLAQKLCALSIDLSRYSREYDGNGNLAAELDQLQQELRNVSKDVVRLSHQLRPATVEGLGLSAALRNLCQEATDYKRTVLFVQSADLPPLSEDISLPLYRIAQESLQNALTHSGATSIHVEISASATTVRLSVRDDGCGFVVGSTAKPGLGLSGMSERMRSSGGLFSITSNPGEGTAVIATMPLTQSMKVGSTR
jgi:PAS domain S-box-containing protein